MTKEKLERYVKRLKEGDTRAFDDIYECTHRAVYFAVFYILRDKMLAEDVLQETFVRALSALGQYREGTNFTAWLCTVGRSLALNELKKRSRETATDFAAAEHLYGSRERAPVHIRPRLEDTVRGRVRDNHAVPRCRLQAARGRRNAGDADRHRDMEEQRSA